MKAPICLLLLVALPVNATPPRPPLMSECVPFQPSSDVIAATLTASKALIPPNASLRSACSYTFLTMETPVVLKETRYFQLHFTWPANKQIEGMTMHENAGCLRNEQQLLGCLSHLPSARLPGGPKFTYGKNIAPAELKELLDQFQSFSVPAAPIVEILKLGGGHPDDQSGEATTYHIVVAEEDKRYKYRMERACPGDEPCNWQITYVGRHYRV